jgi:ribonuclease R
MSKHRKSSEEGPVPPPEEHLTTNSGETPSESATGASRPEKASAAARKLEPIVLAHVLRPNYQPVKPRVIAKQLNLPTEQHRALKLAIRRLVKAGKLAYGDKHIVRPPGSAKPSDRQTKQTGRSQSAPEPPTSETDFELRAAAKKAGREPRPYGKRNHRSDPFPTERPDRNVVLGTFRRTSRGFGFVRPLGAGRGDKSGDIYIPAAATLDAADRDVVRVRLSSKRVRGKGGVPRVTGEIVGVVERQTHRFVGVYKERGGQGYVEVDGKVFAKPVPVGDPGAKGARPDDKVVIEMVRFPTHWHPGEAVLVEVLGPRGSPGVDTLSIIREFDLPEEFPEDVLADARKQAAAFDESLAGRLDLTKLTTVTIDPIDARDFDDAVSLQRLENGHWKLGVHIADVAHFVRARSPLDREARHRGTSVYLPDRVLPMLPEIISNHLASLQPQKIRYTLSAFLEFTPDGAFVGSEVRRAAIKSSRRFTYEEVDEFLADRERWRAKLSPAVWELLAQLHELAMILRARRLEHGAIELVLPEVKIDLDDRGEVVGAHVVKHTESHQIIEEFMLAANEAVARMLSEAGLNFLRRIHEPPDPRKLAALTAFVRELGIPCESLESRFEIKRVIEAVAGKPEQYAVNYAVLRAMQKAIYSPTDEGHYALNKEHYCHFTSPIRRYPDLTIHRMIETLARGKRPADDFERMVALGEHCSEREQRAEAAERELIKVKLLSFLAKRVGETMDGVITGVEDFGLFVQGIELPAEGLVHVDTLGDDFYRYDSVSHSLAGYRSGNRYRLGDLVRVQVARVDVDQRELDFRIVKRLPRPGQPLSLPAEQAPREGLMARKKGASRRSASDHATAQQRSHGRARSSRRRKGR